MLGAVLIFYGILHYFALVFMVICWSYVGIAWTIAIIRKIAGRKSKTLEEFEPEPDDGSVDGNGLRAAAKRASCD